MLILRSARIVRLVAGLSRNLKFNSHHETVGPVRVLSTTFTQRFTATIQRPDKNVDRPINKLHGEVRRTGRFTRRDIEKKLVEIRRNVSSTQSLQLIQCCGGLIPDEPPEVRMAFVQKVWHTLNDLNVPMDISHYNALLKVYVENEYSFYPTEFMASMELKGVEPNRVTYQRLISKYCQEGDIDGATKVIEFMREEQLSINEYVFNAMITGHSEADDIKSAIGILSLMKQVGVEPTANTYAHLMCGYAKHGMLQEISSTLDKCEANKLQLSDKDLLKIIYKLATNGHINYVDSVISRLRKMTDYDIHAENMILRLVNERQDDVALKILKTIPPSPFETGTLYIKQLIKLGRPTETILSICRELQQTGLNNRATHIAAETAAKAGITDPLPFFREVKRTELSLPQQYFWPIITAQAEVGTDAVLYVLRLMRSEFDMTANGETVRDYVIPSLKERSYEKIILRLQTVDIPKPIAVTSCVCHALDCGQIKSAATLASTYGIYYQPALIMRPLVNALIKTNDFRSWISIVRSVYENLPRLQKIEDKRSYGIVHLVNNDITKAMTSFEYISGNPKDSHNASEVVGLFALDAVNHLKESGGETSQKVLESLVEQGLSISKAHAESIEKILESLCTPKLSFLIEQLTSGKLEPVPYKRSKMRLNFSDIMSTKDLTEMIRLKEARGEYIMEMKWALLQARLKANDVPKTEELIEQLLLSGFSLTPPLYSQLIDFYCRNKNVGKALAIYAEIKFKEPDFALDNLKQIEIIHALVENDRIDEAVEFLKSGKKHKKVKEKYQNDSSCWRVLNLLAQKGRDADLTKLFNALEEKNFMKVNDMMLLGLLIKVHLVNNDITKAMTSFEYISGKYKCTPWKSQLSCTLIQLKDANTLQRLVDLSTKVHGEVNSLYDLIFSFIECGCIKQARKILETPALHIRPKALIDACERYREERRTASTALETLIKATSDLENIDHPALYYNLLLAYCKEESPVKAMNLWTRIRKEDEAAITDKFLTTLAGLLNDYGVKVPFVVPKKVYLKKRKPLPKADVLGDAIKAKDDSNCKPNVNEESQMLKMMVMGGQLDSATQLVLKMLEADTCPSLSTFRLYLNNMAKAGQYQIFEQLSPRLSVELKQNLLFVDRSGRAFTMAGKAEQFFEQTIKNCESATTAEELKQNFPSGAMNGILDKHPELLLKFEQFAENMVEREFLTPIQILWSHHIINGKLDQANRIVETYLHEPPTKMFSDLLRTALNRKDDTIALSLLAVVDKNVSESYLAAIHTCLIDVYCSQQRFDEALRAVDRAIREISLESIKRTALVLIKDGLESEGKKFPYRIPDVIRYDAVVRSSDDELRDKWEEFKHILENIFEENVKI